MPAPDPAEAPEDPQEPKAQLWTETGDVCDGALDTCIDESLALWDSMNFEASRIASEDRIGSSFRSLASQSVSSHLAPSSKAPKPSIPLWLHEVYEMQKERKAPPKPTNREFNRWAQELNMKAYEHGRQLDRRECRDLAELSIYHNSVARGGSLPWQAPDLGGAAEELRSLRAQLQANREGSSGNLRSTSKGSTGSDFNRSPGPRRTRTQRKPVQSTGYLEALSHRVDTAGPNQLQRLAQRANISLLNAKKLPKSTVRLGMSSSSPCF